VEAGEPVSDNDDLAALRFLRFLNSLLADPSGPCEPMPALGPAAGAFTPAMPARAMRELQPPLQPDPQPVGWNVYTSAEGGSFRFSEFIPNEEVLSREAEQFAAEVETFAVTWEKCPAVLFAPRKSLATLVRPVQGPSPLACVREPHQEGTWHRDGRTWWR
jgi:hypothetical protein